MDKISEKEGERAKDKKKEWPNDPTDISSPRLNISSKHKKNNVIPQSYEGVSVNLETRFW